MTAASPLLARPELATARRQPRLQGSPSDARVLEKSGQAKHEFLYWEAAGANQTTNQQAVRWGDWKAVRGRTAKDWELYDLKSDEKETTNVVARHPEVMQKIHAIISAEHTPERMYEAAPKETAATFVR